MRGRNDGKATVKNRAFLAMGLFAMGLFVILPVYGGEKILSHEDRIAAELQGHLDAEKVSVVLKGLSSAEGIHRAKEMFCFVRGALLGGMRYDSITIYVESVSFRLVDERVVLRHFQRGKVSGAVLLKDFSEALENVYPAFRIGTVSADHNALVLKGVYVKNTTIPLKATVGFTGTYVPLEDGTASLHFVDSSSDNPFISTRDIARAMEKAAPVLSVQSFFPAQKIREVRIAGETLWFFSDTSGLQNGS